MSLSKKFKQTELKVISNCDAYPVHNKTTSLKISETYKWNWKCNQWW